MQTSDKKQNMEKYPKILVGCPTSFHKDYCLKEYIQGLKGLTYPYKDILIVENSKNDDYLSLIKNFEIPVIKGQWFDGAIERIITSRNILRKKVLDEGYDYFLSLEQDVIPPKDIIERMLQHRKKVISGIYFANNKFEDGKVRLIPLAYKLINKETQTMRPLEANELWDNPGLYPIVSAGLGCVLIHRSVLEQIEFRSENQNFDDRFFFIDCYDKEIEIFCDTTIKCKHMINRPIPWAEIKK
ncbi:hypothetical protein CL616_00335 [archaeon]|nr:hypothetical protein [archaeon]|tara:strand:- start:1814 stop:2539 length:726 start_codon:yes stop_codon:yes gene_type:complete